LVFTKLSTTISGDDDHSEEYTDENQAANDPTNNREDIEGGSGRGLSSISPREEVEVWCRGHRVRLSQGTGSRNLETSRYERMEGRRGR
jgi:hypothetical protein